MDTYRPTTYWPDQSGVFGYRKVDGRNTRWGWFCKKCRGGDDDIWMRLIAGFNYRQHRETDCPGEPGRHSVN